MQWTNQGKVISCGSTRTNSQPTNAVPTTLAATMTAMPRVASPSWISHSATSLTGTRAIPGTRKRASATWRGAARIQRSRTASGGQRAIFAAMAASGRQPHSSTKMTTTRSASRT